MGVYTVSGNRFRVWAATHLGVYTPGGFLLGSTLLAVYTVSCHRFRVLAATHLGV